MPTAARAEMTIHLRSGRAPSTVERNTLMSGRFMRAFLDKAPFGTLLRRMPVKVILHDDAGLLGAAAYAKLNLMRHLA